MTSTHALFDPSLRHLRQNRVQPAALFLHQRARDEIIDRLQIVKRVFTDIAIVTKFPKMWEKISQKVDFVTPGEELNFTRDAYDLIIHDMILHNSNDPLGQFIQCQRMLRPDGLLMMSFFGGESLSELRTALFRTEEELWGGVSPRVHPMIDIRSAGGLLQRANMALPVLDSDKFTIQYGTLNAALLELRHMGEANTQTARSRKPTSRRFWQHVEKRLQNEAGKVSITAELIYITAWKPADNQPKPLRPGSAKFSLHDAMNPSPKSK